MSAAAQFTPGAPRRRRVRDDRRSVALKGYLVPCDDGTPSDIALANLSYGGCQLHTTANLRHGEAVRLFVAGRGKIDAVVRWTRGSSVGLSFLTAEEQEAQRVRVPREADRLTTRLSVLVRRPGRRGQWIDGHDISPLGCRLEFVDPPRRNDRLWVQLPGLETIEARVRWVDGGQVGTLFEHPIHPAVYDLLLERWTSA